MKKLLLTICALLLPALSVATAASTGKPTKPIVQPNSSKEFGE